MNNEFILLNDNTLNYNIKQNQNLSILKLDLENDLTINLELEKQTKTNVNFTCIANNLKHKIEINMNIDKQAIDCNFQVNILGLKKSNTKIELNIFSNKKVNAKINLEVNGIIDGNQATIAVIPKFLFNHNCIEAKHGVIIGSVNQKELNYLLIRGIDIVQAKLLLISAKLFNCLNDLSSLKKEEYKKLILKKWKDNENA